MRGSLLALLPSVCTLALRANAAPLRRPTGVKTKTAYRLLIIANAKYLRRTYGEDFYVRFKRLADDTLHELLAANSRSQRQCRGDEL